MPRERSGRGAREIRQIHVAYSSILLLLLFLFLLLLRKEVLLGLAADAATYGTASGKSSGSNIRWSLILHEVTH